MKNLSKLMSMTMIMGIVALASCSDDPKVQEPSADFSFAVSDLTVTFSDASLNGESYAWSFGDGTTSTEQNPTHTYVEGGDYEVSLAVTNAGGTAFSRQTVTLETEVDYVELLAGRWKMANTAGALGVGPSVGDVSWWNNSADDLAARACYFDDVYVFGADGSFAIELGDGTWLEQWQGFDPPACGAGIAPHDGSATDYSFSAVETTFTLNGAGAYVGLAKAHNGGELGAPGDAPASITYTYDLDADGNSMSVYVEAGAGSGVFWQYKMVKE